MGAFEQLIGDDGFPKKKRIFEAVNTRVFRKLFIEARYGREEDYGVYIVEERGPGLALGNFVSGQDGNKM